MLKSIELKNFRGFREHRVKFARSVVLVGKNNAGKTTLIEALRILSACQARIKNATFIATPEWLRETTSIAGFRPSLKTVDFDHSNVHHVYDTEQPAEIIAKFSNHNEIRVYIGKDEFEVFCQIRRGAYNKVHLRSEARQSDFGITRVMPPIGKFLRHERLISQDRVNEFTDSHLAHRHFRNQLYYNPSKREIFESLLEQTWNGVRVESFNSGDGEKQNEFSLFLREERFVCEAAWVGGGLQAWMQILWFLAKVEKHDTIVLDEPDIYLHADIQRKLIKLLGSLNYKQSIVATHSPDIISDVSPDTVIVIKKRDAVSVTASSTPEVQKALQNLGSVHNIQLSKIAGAGKVLFVEGDDQKFLSEVAFKIGLPIYDRYISVPSFDIGGAGNWAHAIGAAKAFGKAFLGQIETHLLLDRDFKTSVFQEKLLTEAANSGLKLKFWRRKEIENYFVHEEIIARIIRLDQSGGDITSAEIHDMIESCSRDLLEDCRQSYADSIQHENRQLSVKGALAKADDLISERLSSGNRLQDIVGGKMLLSKLSGCSQSKFNVGFSPISLCKAASLSELPNELTDYVRSLC